MCKRRVLSSETKLNIQGVVVLLFALMFLISAAIWYRRSKVKTVEEGTKDDGKVEKHTKLEMM